ncbi:MAG: hypothetical protein E6Q61_05385 [Nitrosomonas sp.]|nr:MAG: hypothetical protein E6Q61_05385 [Nitrosomonas sp.]
MKWIQDQLENHMLFRRLMLVGAWWINFEAANLSFRFAMATSLQSGSDIAIVQTAIQAPAVLLTGYFIKLYCKSADLRK